MDPIDPAKLFDEVSRALSDPTADTPLLGQVGATLLLACGRGDAAAVRTLLARGARPVATALGSPLLTAVRGGHAEVVEALLAAGAPPGEADAWGHGPLHVAAEEGRAALVPALVRAGCAVDALDGDEHTPLLLAVLAGHADAALALLDAGARVHPALHAASHRGDAPLVRALLARGGRTDATLQDGSTPLHLAANAGHVDVVRALLDVGADLAARTRAGDTPLVLAVRGGHRALAGLLELRGAPVAAGDPGLATARLLGALRSGDEATALRALDEGADAGARLQHEGGRWPALTLAAAHGQARVVAALLARGADVAAPIERDAPPWRRTALHEAAAAGAREAVEALLAGGADASARDEDVEAGGNGPLHLAAAGGHAAVVAALVARGASVEARDVEGLTPLMLAAAEGHVEAARALLDAGAKVDAKGPSGPTALVHAAQHGHAAVADLLLERGADARVRPSGAPSPLSAAAAGGHLDLARALLAAGADPSEAGRAHAPLHEAVLHGHRDVLEALLARGADPDARDAAGFSALDCARAVGRPDLMGRLVAAGATATGPPPTPPAAPEPTRAGRDAAGVLVDAPFDDVVRALAASRGVTVREDLAEGTVLSVRRLPGLRWTVISLGDLAHDEDARGLGEDDARELSARLGARALWAVRAESAGLAGYALYERGALVERLRAGDVDHGQRDEAEFEQEPGDVVVESRRRALRAADVDDPFEFLDRALHDEQARLPAPDEDAEQVELLS